MAVSSVAMTGCDDDFDCPPVIIPEATIEANTTILELKQAYWQDGSTDYMTTIGQTAEGEHVIIAGRVISNDAEGNVYQRVILEDATSAITVRVYASDLFESYHYGQEVVMDVTGLKIGTYRGLQMIGVEYNGSVGGMDLDEMKSRAQVNGLPQTDKVVSYPVTIADLTGGKGNQEYLMTWQTRLVKLENVTFEGGGEKTFGTPGAQNYTTTKLKDAAGNTIDVSTSNRCDFAGTYLPAGTGTVTAILSYFGSNWQLVLNDPETDCTGGFDFSVRPAKSLYEGLNEDAATCDWTFENVKMPSTMTHVWSWATYNNKHYLNASGYVGGKANETEAYAISPVIDLSGVSEASVSFEQAAKFQTTLRSLCGIYVRLEGATDWTQLTIPAWCEAGSWTFASSGAMSLNAYAGKKIQLAFKYGSSSAGADTWEVKNVKITGKQALKTKKQ